LLQDDHADKTALSYMQVEPERLGQVIIGMAEADANQRLIGIATQKRSFHLKQPVI
jgi:hypothetical protein